MSIATPDRRPFPNAIDDSDDSVQNQHSHGPIIINHLPVSGTATRSQSSTAGHERTTSHPRCKAQAGSCRCGFRSLLLLAAAAADAASSDSLSAAAEAGGTRPRMQLSAYSSASDASVNASAGTLQYLASAATRSVRRSHLFCSRIHPGTRANSPRPAADFLRSRSFIRAFPCVSLAAASLPLIRYVCLTCTYPTLTRIVQ